MLIREIITERLIDEDVPIRDTSHMAAYAIVVAEAYDAAPQHDPSVTRLWQDFAQQNRTVMLGKIAKAGVKVEYTPDDPYGSDTDDPKMMIRYMLWDMVMNQRLQIYAGHSDNHPVFSEQDNVIFRTVHDYFTHGRLRAMFKQQLAKMGLLHRRPTPEQLAAILPTIKLDLGGNIGHTFTMRGEINAFLTHSRLVSPKLVPVLFTEVVGQVCYHVVADNFPVQKAAILQGFDYKRVGQITAPAIATRMQQLIAALASEPTIHVKIAARPEVKSADILAKVTR